MFIRLIALLLLLLSPRVTSRDASKEFTGKPSDDDIYEIHIRAEVRKMIEWHPGRALDFYIRLPKGNGDPTPAFLARLRRLPVPVLPHSRCPQWDGKHDTNAVSIDVGQLVWQGRGAVELRKATTTCLFGKPLKCDFDVGRHPVRIAPVNGVWAVQR